MGECAYCGTEPEGFPYTCNECGENHCSTHRLPERHDCDGLARVADRQSGQGVFIGQSYDQSDGSHGDGNTLSSALDSLLGPFRRFRR
ncbi:AN1-type zinc finger domain-containing protein [Haloarchaeobius amylolyticus]|uniref:AN1-type zinc finger domain-containing protein n=1 Tax=Haloarchaeobius amylolyticus TaxID=1198296 RepID=UPI00226F45A3|nr:AN1-type zinc finger domain-containing protein [Haloarchaeobius amylolyticus]